MSARRARSRRHRLWAAILWGGAASIGGVSSLSAAPPEAAAQGLRRAGAAGTLHHATVDVALYPWSSVGKLYNSVGGSCTAAVIAPDKVLTAAHCLYAFRTRRFLRAESIHFLLGYRRGDYSLHARVARIGLGPGYDPVDEVQTAPSDWAVLTLAEPLPSRIRPLALAETLPAAGSAVAIGGFAQDRAYLMTADTGCRLTAIMAAGRLLTHDCVIRHGDSGAPVLFTTGAGAVEVLGVAVGFLRTAGRQASIAAPVTAAILSTAEAPR